MKSTTAFLVSFLFSFGVAPVTAIAADDYPSRPLTLVVPFAAGGPLDFAGRALAEGLGKELGQSIVVENRSGATGIVGLEAFERSAPDGYTLGLFTGSTAYALAAQKRKFELTRQMTPLGNIMTSVMLLVVNPNMIDVHDINGLMAYLREHPRTAYTSSGTGSPAHLMAEHWAKKNRFELNHVAYRGMAPALVDILGNRVGLVISSGTTVMPHIKAGKLRVIAALSDKRLGLLPEVKTSAEQGHADLKLNILNGALVTAGTPAPIVEKLRNAVEKVVKSESYRNSFKETDSEIDYISGPEWGKSVQSYYDNANLMIKEADIRFD